MFNKITSFNSIAWKRVMNTYSSIQLIHSSSWQINLLLLQKAAAAVTEHVFAWVVPVQTKPPPYNSKKCYTFYIPASVIFKATRLIFLLCFLLAKCVSDFLFLDILVVFWLHLHLLFCEKTDVWEMFHISFLHTDPIIHPFNDLAG